MYTQKPHHHSPIAVLFLSLVLQNCGQPNQEFGNMEASSASERLDNTTDQVSPPFYGPFAASLGALVTFQQEEGPWSARVEETGAPAREQHLGVSCAGDITETLSQLQHQPADRIKSRAHVLSSAQSPYLEKLGLSGGMEQGGEENDISTLISLHKAAQEGNLANLKYLVEEKKADVSTRNNDGKAVLHWAAQGGNIAVIKYLVEEKKADVNARDNRRKTALHWAAEKGNISVIKYLVEEKNTDVNARDSQRRTALHYAAIEGHLAIIEYLVEEREADVSTRDKYGATALHLAARGGDLAVIKCLVEEKEVDVNARDGCERTVLHWAAEEGHLAIIKYLVEEKEADVNAQDERERTALHDAAKKGHLAVIKYLVEEKEVDVNARDECERTALHLAAEEGHLAVIEYLVEKKADVNTRDVYGGTGLHWAAFKGHLAVIKYLIEKGEADVSARDNHGMTGLHDAATKGHLAVIEYLVEQGGADVSARDDDERTALHLAVKRGDIVVIQYLVEKGKADVNTRDEYGRTVLHLAAEEGHLAILKYLVKEGEADVNARDKYAKTTLHLAVERGDIAVIKYLAEKNADVNARDNQGMTALHLAAQEGQLEIILYLMEEAEGAHNPQIIEDIEHLCFEQWKNIGPYVRFITLADRLYSKESPQTLRPEEISATTVVFPKLKLAYGGQGTKPSKECPHDLGTAFSNRFKNRIRREGVPEAMLLDPEGYFKNILPPDSLRTELQTLVDLINAGREIYSLHASSLVALLEVNEEISSTPLSFILCPPENFRPYNPEDLVQKRTVEFYTQRNAELAKLVKNAKNVGRELSFEGIQRVLCKYLLAYLSQLEPHGETIKSVVEDGARKDLVVSQIQSMLVEDDVLLPTGLKAKLALLLKELLTPSVPQAI